MMRDSRINSVHMDSRFDPEKDVANQRKHNLPLAFGDRIFDDANHVIIPSIREQDGEERFKAWWATRCSPACSYGATACPGSCPCEGAIKVKKERIILPSDPTDPEDFDVTAEALDRAQRARFIRKIRTDLGLSQAEFAKRFRVPVGTLRDWEQARATAPDFAIAYVRVIRRHPDLVDEALA
jgi:putative transcriptional regulator